MGKNSPLPPGKALSPSCNQDNQQTTHLQACAYLFLPSLLSPATNCVPVSTVRILKSKKIPRPRNVCGILDPREPFQHRGFQSRAPRQKEGFVSQRPLQTIILLVNTGHVCALMIVAPNGVIDSVVLGFLVAKP